MRCSTTSASGRPGRWFVKVRAGGAVRNKACYVAIGVNLEGERDVLELSSQSSEGAKVRKTIKTRGHFPTEEAARKLIYLLDHQRSGELATNLQLERPTAFLQDPLRRPTALTRTLGCRGKSERRRLKLAKLT